MDIIDLNGDNLSIISQEFRNTEKAGSKVLTLSGNEYLVSFLQNDKNLRGLNHAFFWSCSENGQPGEFLQQFAIFDTEWYTEFKTNWIISLI